MTPQRSCFALTFFATALILISTAIPSARSKAAFLEATRMSLVRFPDDFGRMNSTVSVEEGNPTSTSAA